MSSIHRRISSHPGFEKFIEWSKLIALTGSAQIIVQILGLISGIIIIRLLPTKEYAFYTIANTMLGTITLLSDAGISTGVMSQGSKVWQDRIKFGSVLSTGMELRKKFAIISLIFSTPILIYLLIHQGESWLFAILIAASLIPSFFAALSDNLLEIPPKLHQDIKKLQKNQLEAGIGRFILISASLFIFPWTFVAIIGNGIPRLLANRRLRKISNEYVDFGQKQDMETQKKIIGIVRRSLPEIIYYCFSGQITIWIISFLGSSLAVAQLGALGRISLTLNIFAVLFGTLIIPRFARLPKDSKILLHNFIKVITILFITCLAIIGIVFLFSSELLWILGKNYYGLEYLLRLNFVGGCLGLFVGIIFSLYASRGWIIHPVISIISNLLILISGIAIFRMSDITGVLWYNIYIGGMQALMHLIFAFLKILKVNKG